MTRTVLEALLPALAALLAADVAPVGGVPGPPIVSPTGSKGCALPNGSKPPIAVLVVFLLAGCGGGEDGASGPRSGNPDASTTGNAGTSDAAPAGSAGASEGTMAVKAAGATQEQTTVPAAPDGARAENCDGGTVRLNAAEKKLVKLHNRTRTQRGLEPLCVDPTLTRAAHAHSEDMIEKDYFAHATPGGEFLGERLKRFGYTPEGYRFWKVGGNVAWHSGAEPEPEKTFEGWMNSPPHRKNILEENFRQIGIGTARGAYKGYEDSVMYTAQFGVRR